MSPLLPTKRKLQHHDHQSPHSHLIKMSKHNSNATSQLQFFVRMIPQGKTLVLHANSQDTVKSLHHKIETITGIPFFEQRLIYCGKQLHWDQTLAQSSLQNDAGLQLVGRMRSTPHPQAWQVIDEMVSFIFRLCKGTDNSTLAIKLIKSRLTEFLNITTRNDNEEATGYLQIFMSSCVPSALVMLFLSQNEANKDCAGDCIRQFVTSSVILLPEPMYAQCAPIVLEFCKLLGRVARDDSLYTLCRCSFGSMVKYVGVGRGGKEGVIGVEEILPFVGEIASSLSRDLVASMDLTTDDGPLVGDVRDFSVFLFPLRTAIMEQVGFEGPVSMNLCKGGYNVSCYGEEIEFLYGIFIDLLDKMEQCLQRMEECLTMKEKGNNGCLALKEREDGGWCQCLAILKELHSISELYKGADELFWSKLRCRKGSVSYLIIKYAKRNDDHQWILEHKDITNFESRRHLAMMMLPELKHEYEEFHEMLIDRSQLLAESFEYVAHADPDTLRSGMFLEFKNEEATGPGVLREWFFLVCQAIFNHQNALFVTCPNDRRRFFPNPASKVDPLHLEYFSFSGRVIALALMHKVQVGIVFDRVFFLQLAGMSVALEDVRDADPYLYHSCKQILEMDAETVDQDALGLTFAREVEELGTRRVVDLCPDGSGISVNSKNRREYVDLLIEHRFVTSIAEQVANFSQGFADIITSTRLQKSFFQSLDLEDLDWMLHGSESDISVEDWKAHTEYKGYKESDPQIFWFWKIVGEMSLEQRKALLFFWTSVKYLPIEGFCGLASRVYICRSTEPYDRLPSSHTCFYQLCFPPYPSLYVMQDRLGLVTQEHVGCSFGTW